jgi:hypothetical protein
MGDVGRRGHSEQVAIAWISLARTQGPNQTRYPLLIWISLAQIQGPNLIESAPDRATTGVGSVASRSASGHRLRLGIGLKDYENEESLATF